MGTIQEHEKRSQDIADTTRRIAVTLNSGGIGLVFTVAANLTKDGTSASWAIFPAVLFLIGLLLIGISLFLAKHRELKRRDAAKQNIEEPENFKKWYWRSFNWDLISFLFFVTGASIGLLSLTCLLDA